MPIKKMPESDSTPYLGEKKVKKQSTKVSHARKTTGSSSQKHQAVDAKIVSAPKTLKKIPHSQATDLFSLSSSKEESPSPSRKKAEKVFSHQEKKEVKGPTGKTQTTPSQAKTATSTLKASPRGPKKEISSSSKKQKKPLSTPPVSKSSSSHAKKKSVGPPVHSAQTLRTHKKKTHYDENSTLTFFQATAKHSKKHSVESINTQPSPTPDKGIRPHAQIPEIKSPSQSKSAYHKRIIVHEEDLHDYPPATSTGKGVGAKKILHPVKKSIQKIPFIVGLISLICMFFLLQHFLKKNTILPTSQVTRTELSSFEPTATPSLALPETTLSSPVTNTVSDIHFVIQPGMGAQSVCTALSALGFDGESLLTSLVNQGLEGEIVSGTYLLQSNMTTDELISRICSSKQVNITIFAGMSIAEIDASLVQRGWIESGDFLHACTQLCAKYGLNFVEGWFASGVYTVERENIATSLSSQMFQKLLSFLSPHLTTIAQSGYSIADVVIIATLIQAETQDPDQMGLISSVIHNRLKKNMALGIDATTRYETGNKTEALSLEVLNTLTPYNTRRKKGLVPSGICCPSIDAIQAAVEPDTTDYLYYLHKSDKSIVMATTYEEHKQNIKESQSEV